MPIARLISRAPDEAHELAAHLRARGFTVEIVSPEETPDHHADLEIKLEEYSTEEALRMGEELSQTEDLHVFIAPGAILEKADPSEVIGEPLETSPVIEEALPVEEVIISQEQQPDTTITSPALAAETIVEEPVLPYVPVDHVAAIEEARFSFEVKEEVQEEAEVEAAAIDTVIANRDSVTQPVAEEPVPEQPAFAMEAAEVFPPSDWPVWQPLAEESVDSEDTAVPVEVEAQPPVASPRTLSFPRSLALHPNERTFWRIAALASVGALGVLLLGMSAHRFSPLPSGLDISEEQHVPFDRAKAGKTISQETVADTTPNPAPQAPELKRVVARVPVAEKPSPVEHIGKPARQTHRVEKAAKRQHDDYVAEDTVVRHTQKPAATSLQAQKKAGIKRYTDLR